MTGIFFTKDVQWAMATVDVVEYWNHVIIFFLQQRQLSDHDKKTTKKIVTLSHLHAPFVILTKDKKKKMSHCPISIKKNWQKTTRKKLCHCLISIKNFFSQKTTRNKFLTQKKITKKLPHCCISTLLSPCSMLIPLCSHSHAPVYMLPSSHV